MKLKLVTADDELFVDAMKKVRTRLANSKIKAKEFDMQSFHSKFCDAKTHKCGTSHCIGGWVDLELGSEGKNNPTSYLKLSPQIEYAASALFFPDPDKAFNSKRKHAVEAIDNFLKGHKNPWKRVNLSSIPELKKEVL